VQGADADDEQQSTEAAADQVVVLQRNAQRERAEGDGEQEGERNQEWVPADQSGNPKRRHAGVMHGVDAEPHDGTAQPLAARALRPDGDRETDAGHHDGGHDRERGEADVEARRNAGPVGEHGDEVGRPDRAAGGDSAGREPGQPAAARCGDGALDQRHHGVRAENADEGGECHQTKIVLMSQAKIDAHRRPFLLSRIIGKFDPID
jgi:hypothetical protein